MNKESYRVVISAGAKYGDKKYPLTATCGHNHNSIEAARKCLAKKRNHGKNKKWYNARIINEEGRLLL